MPVGTDAMILGAWADPAGSGTILDLGTGCGVIALMMAQRSNARIDAIDIDETSAVQAGRNFSASPWKARLMAECADAAGYRPHADTLYDFIITNPPFFTDSLKPASPKRRLARHDTGLSPAGLAAAASRLLSPGGSFAVILPATSFGNFSVLAEKECLYPRQMLTVRSFESREPVRIAALFSKSEGIEVIREELVIFDAPGRFSARYLEMTADFHNF